MPTAQEYFTEVGGLMKQSEFLKAYDLANTALREHPEDRQLQHRAVLALARVGAPTRAQARFVELGLDAVGDDEEILALAARLQKDLAFALPRGGRGAKLAEAASTYERAYHSGGGGYFPAINVASLHLLAGARDEALEWAELADRLAASDPSYYGVATRAEAAVVRQDFERAGEMLAHAASLANEDYASMRSTRQQLRRLLTHLDQDADAMLAPLSATSRLMHSSITTLVAPSVSIPSSSQLATTRRRRTIVRRAS